MNRAQADPSRLRAALRERARQLGAAEADALATVSRDARASQNERFLATWLLAENPEGNETRLLAILRRARAKVPGGPAGQGAGPKADREAGDKLSEIRQRFENALDLKALSSLERLAAQKPATGEALAELAEGAPSPLRERAYLSASAAERGEAYWTTIARKMKGEGALAGD
jgi:hypothetical protein